jgi:hypothetical protein
MAVSTSRRGGGVLAAVVTAVAALAMLGRVAWGGNPGFTCGPASAQKGFAFCNAALPAEQRAADLVARLTTAEKVGQLGDQAPGVPRLGIPVYKWWSEALHGLAISGKGIHFGNGPARTATSFPQVIHTAAAFDDGLWFRIGQVRVYTHVFLRWRADRSPPPFTIVYISDPCFLYLKRFFFFANLRGKINEGNT